MELKIPMKAIPEEVIDLIVTMYPSETAHLSRDASLTSILNVTKKWIVLREQRLNANIDQYALFTKKIFKAVDALRLRESKRPHFQDYECVLILGSTGLSQFQIWKDLITFHQNDRIHFKKIFLLGGDRAVHLLFDSLNIAYKLYPEDFKTQISDKEIKKCGNEMEMMNLISSSIKLPDVLESVPVISIFTSKPKGETQSNTEDTLNQFIYEQEKEIEHELPILIMSTLPYIARQGLQAGLVMKNYQIDIAATYHPYLETIETSFKGELPLALYLDEIHWLLCCMDRVERAKNTNFFTQVED